MGIRSIVAAQVVKLRLHSAAPLVALVALVSTALFAAMLWVQPLLAAVEFNFFNVISSPAGVVLEWSTQSEANISGFDVLCKRSDEAETQYHSIGYVPAKGAPGVDALYTFPVTALEPGVAYCFRLVELTNDGTPGEVVDRCGYGISITPTPQLIGVQPSFIPGATPAVTPTPGGVPGFDPFAATATAQALQFVPTLDPFYVTATAQALQFPPTLDPFYVTATAQAQQFPPTLDPFYVTATAQAQAGYPAPGATPTFTPPPPGYPGPQSNAGAPDMASVAEPTASVPPAVADMTAPGLDSALALAPDLPQVRSDPVNAVPTPAYIVATATPTLEAVVFGPGMTPLPTVTPTPGYAQIVNLIEPTGQNLMVMLLCMTFTGATGLGILGLITSVMFMRSRSSQREFYDRHSSRRRY